MSKLKCSGNFSELSHVFPSLRKLVYGTWQPSIITNITAVNHIEELPSLQPIIKNQLKYDCIVFTAQWKKVADLLGTLSSHTFQSISSIWTMPENDTSSMQRKSKYEWVSCSENWQDSVIIHVPQLNVIPIKDNDANLSIKEIKNIYFQHSCCKRSYQKRPK